MGLTPEYRLVANDQDITDKIRERFSSLRMTDETGLTSDTIEIVLADHLPDQPINMPPTGAEVELSLGYDGHVRRMGLFVIDEVELDGWPATMTLRGRASPYDGTPKGKTDFQTQKTRSWKVNTTIGAMVAKIAKEHGMEAAVSSGMASVKLPHLDQSSESDISFLTRIARKYDAIAKPAGGKLIFSARGDSKSVAGADLPRVTLTPDQVSSYRCTLAKREAPGTVVAFYRNTSKAERHEVKIGSGDPVKRLRMGFKNQDMALAAAKAEQSRRARGEVKLTVELPGNELLTAEATVILEGFRQELAGEWLATSVTHDLTKRGYMTTVDCERPNANKDVKAATNGSTSDVVDDGSGDADDSP